VFMNTRNLSDLAKSFFPKERIQLPAPMNGVAGTPISHFVSQNGVIRLEPDVFLRPKTSPPTVGRKYAPNAPGAIAAPVVAPNVQSLHTIANYYYWVSAAGIKETESAPTAVDGGSVVSVGAGDGVTISIPQVSAGTYAKNPRAYYYNVYRGTTTDPRRAGFIGSVADPRNTSPGSGAAAVFVDNNLRLPGTSTAFGMYMDGDEGLSFKQLAPLMKVDLATVSASIRWMILLYGMLQVYAPTKMILFINVGQLQKK
jgi:hypothetical protein